jgi:peptide/nickel transport system ATP-binding protein/oligopeptide transport system ATP-binding protein
MSDAPKPLLSVEELCVSFNTEDGLLKAVDGVSFTIAPGEIVALVGESGSGKSVTAMTLLGLTRSPNSRFEGRATLDETELIQASEDELESIRGNEIAMVFQDPMSSLDPVYRVGDQIAEQILAHEPKTSKQQALDRAVELMRRVGIPRAEERVTAYPHEFSGGMRQRVMIAMALSCSPRLLIADEPTTALDVTIQAQIVNELKQLRDETGASVLLVTHDLALVADVADRVLVMYAGRLVEQCDLDETFYNPQHPYTWGLLGSRPRIDSGEERLSAIPGAPPSLLDPPQGCRLQPRCPFAFEKCGAEPALESRLPSLPAHLDRCWLTPDEKRELRERDGAIGLFIPEAAAAEDGA